MPPDDTPQPYIPNERLLSKLNTLFAIVRTALANPDIDPETLIAVRAQWHVLFIFHDLIQNPDCSIEQYLNPNTLAASNPVRESLFQAIERERKYQDALWGTLEAHAHFVIEWIEILQERLNKARDAYYLDSEPSALHEILTVAAVAVACLEQHGIVERQNKNGQ